MVREFPPMACYRLGAHRCWIMAYHENGTVRVAITQEDNPETTVLLDRQVFGVDPCSLSLADAPPRVEIARLESK